MSSQLQVSGEAKIRDIQGPVVANSGVITALDGAASQYVRGDGTLADFPTSSGGGSSVSYYLNSSVSQGTIGGVAYRELNKEPIIGAGTDIAIAANGYVASYLTDANDPDVLSIPGGNFNCEFYFSVSNDTGNPFFYAELYKYDGTTFTLLGSSVGVPEYINQGTIIAPYYFAIPVPTSALAVTDRLAIRIYVNVDGRTVTLHTENSHLCQVVTTLSKGMVSLNNLTDQSQYLTTGTSGTDFNIVSSGDTHTFNIPSASASNRGLITTGNQTIAGNKVFLAGVNVDNLQVVNATLLNHQTGLTPTLVGTTAIGGSANGLFFNVNDNGRIQEFIFDSTGDRDYTFPAASGTIALTSNLSSYVPYTGATASVDLGAFSLTADTLNSVGIFSIGSGTQSGYIGIKQGTTFLGNISGYNSINANGTKFILISDIGSSNYKSASFQLSSLTNNTERTFTLPDITGTLALLEGTQTFSGAKTFANNVKIDNGVDGNYIGFKQYATGSTGTTGFTTLYSISTNGFGIGFGTTKAIQFDSASITTFRTYTFPDANGTLALTSDLSAYVTLGTSQTISGQKTFTVQTNFAAKINATNNQGIGFYNTGSTLETTLYPSIGLSANRTIYLPNASGTIALTSDIPSNIITGTGTRAIYYIPVFSGSANTIENSIIQQVSSNIGIGVSPSFKLDVNGTGRFTGVLTLDSTISNGTYTYTLPSATGTLALTSNLSAYLPLTGGTLTGALSGTSAYFSDNLGLGTSSPVGQASNNRVLQIVGAGTGIRAQIKLTNSVSGATGTDGLMLSYDDQLDGYLYNFENGGLLFGTNNAVRLTIASTGAATFSGGLLTVNVPTDNTTVGIFHAGGGTANRGLKISTFVATNDNAGVTLDAQTSTGVLAFATAGAEKMRITNAGNVAIGTGVASVKLTVSNPANGDIAAFTNTNDADFYINLTSGVARLASGTNILALGTNNTERMRITSGGNVGIGTSSPSELLHLYKSSTVYQIIQTVSGGSGTVYRRSNSATPDWTIGHGAASANENFEVYTAGTGDFTWTMNGGERMRITSGGLMLLGATSSYTDYGLIQITGDNKGIAIRDSDGAYRAIYNQSGTLYFWNGSNEGYLSSAGAWVNASDVSIKKDVKEIEYGLNEVLKLKPKSYKMIDNDLAQIGFIAQEVEEILPELVDESKKGMKGLSYGQMTAVLVKAIQELTQKVNELESKIK